MRKWEMVIDPSDSLAISETSSQVGDMDSLDFELEMDESELGC